MGANFVIPDEPVGDGFGDAVLRMVGYDSEGKYKTQVRIDINGSTVYEGDNPLPNDFFPYNPDEGNWGHADITFPAYYLQRGTNEITITNLEPEGDFGQPPFVMLDHATITFNPTPVDSNPPSPTDSSVTLYVDASSVGKGGVNVRALPDPDADLIFELDNGTAVEALGEPVRGVDGMDWYQVLYQDETGYIRARSLSRQRP